MNRGAIGSAESCPAIPLEKKYMGLALPFPSTGCPCPNRHRRPAMTMVKQVARAIAAERRRVVPGGPPPTQGEMPRIQIEGYIPAARAAIRAMMEPTLDMVKAAQLQEIGYPPPLQAPTTRVWQAMLQAALDEKP